MTDLIACLSVGKGTWNEVENLVNSKEFSNIYLITNVLIKEKLNEFNVKDENIKSKLKIILINPKDNISKIIDDINNSLKGRITDFDVAVNLNSGIGKEHMAIISSILKLGTALRLVKYENGIKEI